MNSRKNLKIEKLQDRRLMAADVVDGVLTIEGTQADDHIEVAEVTRFEFVTLGQSRFGKSSTVSIPILRRELIVETTDASGNVDSETFDGNDVDSIVMYGRHGDDHLANHTSLPSTIYGSFGNDSLIGGSAADRVYGSSGDDIIDGGRGNDRLYASSGNDVVRGGDGDDVIYGQSGNDELFGQNGDDYVSGGSGNDHLSGGHGNDTLRGFSGTDGLYGGPGQNSMQGGLGMDRFLDHPEHQNTISDKSWSDVTVHMRDVDADNRPVVADLVNGPIGDGDWTENEVAAVDRAFQDMVDRTNNNNLLRTSIGQEYNFFRTSDAEVGFAGYNTLEGTIILNDNAFALGQEWTSLVTFHEVGHSWHFDRWDEWLSFSDWRQENLSDVGDGVVNFVVGVVNFLGGDLEEVDSLENHSRRGNSSWWHSNNAEFFSDYARTDPAEDYAEAFAYAMMDDAGMEFDSDLGVEMGRENLSFRLRQKFDFVNETMDSSM